MSTIQRCRLIILVKRCVPVKRRGALRVSFAYHIASKPDTVGNAGVTSSVSLLSNTRPSINAKERAQ